VVTVTAQTDNQVSITHGIVVTLTTNITTQEIVTKLKTGRSQLKELLHRLTTKYL
jgi:hypothetical protein